MPQRSVQSVLAFFQSFFNFVDLTNKNRRREIQIIFKKHLELLLQTELQRHTDHLETIAIQLNAILILATYVPDGTTDNRIIQSTSTSDLDLSVSHSRLEHKDEAINTKVNLAGTLFDKWRDRNKKWKVYHSRSPTCKTSRRGSTIDLTLIFNEDQLTQPLDHQVTNDFAMSYNS
jgi:hypothetical protein